MTTSKVTSQATYSGETFKRADHSGSLIASSTFSQCRFVRCNFTETDFQACRFLDCTFEDCNMKLAKVDGTTFSQVRFRQCNLLGVKWTEANWSDWTAKLHALVFESCVLEYGVFFGLELAKLKLADCNAREVNFSEANLTEADFAGTDLAGAVFLGANLTRVNFVGALNYTVSVTENKVKGARFALPEAIRLLHGLGIVLVDPATDQPMVEPDSESSG